MSLYKSKSRFNHQKVCEEVEKLKYFNFFLHRSSSLVLDKYEGRAVDLTGTFFSKILWLGFG